MKQRGRVSSAALSVVRNDSVHAIRRPGPPGILDTDEARVWVEIVERLPADWFTQETHTLLIQFCRHTVRANQVRAMIQHELDAGPKMDKLNYYKLGKLELQLSGGLANLATKMRITQQSSYDRKKSKPLQASHKLSLLDLDEDDED